MGDFVGTKWFPGEWRIRATCLDDATRWHNVRNIQTTVFGSYFECGFDEPVFTMVVHVFFAPWFVVYSATGEHKKMGNVVLFPNVAPTRLHHKLLPNFVWGIAFENQMMIFGGIDDLIYSVMEKKEPSKIGRKWVSMKLESAKKCAIHIPFLPSVIFFSAPSIISGSTTSLLYHHYICLCVMWQWPGTQKCTLHRATTL